MASLGRSHARAVEQEVGLFGRSSSFTVCGRPSARAAKKLLPNPSLEPTRSGKAYTVGSAQTLGRICQALPCSSRSAR